MSFFINQSAQAVGDFKAERFRQGEFEEFDLLDGYGRAFNQARHFLLRHVGANGVPEYRQRVIQW